MDRFREVRVNVDWPGHTILKTSSAPLFNPPPRDGCGDQRRPRVGGGRDNYVASFPSPQSTLLSRIRGVFVVCGVAGSNAALWGRINFILIGEYMYN